MPLTAGILSRIFSHDKRWFWASIFIGALVTVILILFPIASKQGWKMINPGLALIILIIAGIWPIFFFLGWKLARPFREIWVEKYGAPNEIKSYEETFK